MPYKLLGAMSITDGETTSNITDAVSESGPSYIPPHLQDTMSFMSMSNPYEDDDDTIVAGSESNRYPLTFTAYDPTGRAHIQQRLPSGTTQSFPSRPSSLGPSASQQPAKNSARASKWGKPVSEPDCQHLTKADTLASRSVNVRLLKNLTCNAAVPFLLVHLVDSRLATRAARMRCSSCFRN